MNKGLLGYLNQTDVDVDFLKDFFWQQDNCCLVKGY